MTRPCMSDWLVSPMERWNELRGLCSLARLASVRASGRGVIRCVSGQSAERVIQEQLPRGQREAAILLLSCLSVAKLRSGKNNNNSNNIYIPNFLADMIFSIFLFVLSLVSKLFNLDWQRLIFSVKRNKMTMSLVFGRSLVLVLAAADEEPPPPKHTMKGRL